MNGLAGKSFDSSRMPELISEFEGDTGRWKPLLIQQYEEKAAAILKTSRAVFITLIPQMPYIGGEQSYTRSLLQSVRCLAFYKSMIQHGKTAREAGKILYDAIIAQAAESQPAAGLTQNLSPEELMERRRQKALWSQEHRFPGGYVYQFVPGDGVAFDYGYDFLECAAQKFYHSQGADEFMPYFCYLDFAASSVYGPELLRTMTLAEGFPKCNHRFRIGKKGKAGWPPPFLKEK